MKSDLIINYHIYLIHIFKSIEITNVYKKNSKGKERFENDSYFDNFRKHRLF